MKFENILLFILFILVCSTEVIAQDNLIQDNLIQDNLIQADINMSSLYIENGMIEEIKPVLPADGRMTLPTLALRDIREITKEQKINLAIKKATRIVETFAAHRNSRGELTRASFLPYVDDLVLYCYQIAEEHNAPEFAQTWYWALVYGLANFGLTCYGTAPGNCTGPFDVKHYPRVIDPIANMKHHVNEQFTGWQRGYRGIGLCKYIMYPARPHDWGGRYRRDPFTGAGLGNMKQFAYWNYALTRCIERGYEYGKLP